MNPDSSDWAPKPALPVIDGWLRLCRSGRLAEGGEAVRFDLPLRPGARMIEHGFAIRFEGRVRAYLNRCAHVPVALDWVPGQVFDPSGLTLLCSVHGAEYDPASGRCLSGPCSGRGHLDALVAAERDGWAWIRVQPDGRAGTPAADGGPPPTLEFRDDD